MLRFLRMHDFPPAVSRRLQTDRLILTPHGIEDFDDYFRMWSDPEVTKYTTGRPSTREEAWGRLQRCVGHWAMLGFGYWAVRDRETLALVGEVGFADFRRDIEPPLGDAPEAGWAIVPQARGRGFATEALTAALAWADQHLGRRRTVCIISPENMVSRRLAERCGYRTYGEATYKSKEVLLYERISPPTLSD